MPSNPYLQQYKGDLQDRFKRRQQYRDEGMGALTKGALAVGTAALTAKAVGTLHPKGSIGMAEGVAKRVGAAQGAAKAALKKVGGREAFTGSLGFKGLSPTKYMSSIDKFRQDTLPNVGHRASQVKDTFLTEYSDLATQKKETALDATRKEVERKSQQAPLMIKSSEIYKRMDKHLDEVAEQGGQKAKAVGKVRDELGHRLGGLAYAPKNKAKLEFMEAGLDEESSDAMMDALQKTKEEVNEWWQKRDGEQVVDEFREKMMQGIIDERQDSITRGIIGRTGKESRGLLESFLGYRKATMDDIQKAGSIDGVDIQEETLRFMNELKRKGADPNKFIPDPNILVQENNNKVVSAINVSEQLRKQREELSEGLIGKLLYQTDMMMAKDYRKKPAVTMQAGHHQLGALTDTEYVGDDFVLKETLVGIKDSAYRFADDGKQIKMEKVKSGLEFTSGKYSTTQRLLRQMSGIDAPDWDRQDAPWWESKALDISADSQPGAWSKWKSVFTKKRDPNYLPNQFQQIGQDVLTGKDIDPQQARKLHRYVTQHAPSLPDKVMEELTRNMDDVTVDLSSKKGLIDTYADLAYRIDDTGMEKDMLKSKAANILDQSRVLKNKAFFKGNEFQEGEEIIKKHISRMIIGEKGASETNNIVNFMFQKGDLVANQKDKASKAIADQVIDEGMRYSNYGNTKAFSDAMRGATGYGGVIGDVKDMLSETHPKMGFGRVDYSSKFRGDVLAIQKFDMSKIGDVFAGRNNLEDVHRGTLYPYGVASRLNEIVKELDFMPLHMTDESMGSTPEIFANIFAKRIMPIYAGLEAGKYIDDHMKEHTGYTMTQRYERGKAHTRMATADITDTLPVTSFMQQLDKATPGSEGLSTFLMNAPIQGPTMPLAAAGGIADFTGALSTRDKEDWIDYYEHGKDPVRRNRYWILGDTPWMGQGISHHEPNSYQQAMSEWRYTDTVYGSKENYWKHSFLPTPRYPLAPIRRFVTDRYWWEDMQSERRPYPVTGGFADSDTPWGILMNMGPGRLLKPQKHGYTEGYDREQIESDTPQSFTVGRYTRGDLQLEDITPKYLPREGESSDIVLRSGGQEQPGYNVRPKRSGQSTPYKISQINNEDVLVDQTSGKIIREEEYTTSSSGIPRSDLEQGTLVEMEDGLHIPNLDPITEEGSNMIADASGVGGGTQASIQDLRAVNTATRRQSTIQTMSVSASDLGYTIPHRQGFEHEDPAEIRDPSSLEYQLERTYYMWGQKMPGARGFAARAIFGGDDYGEGSAVLESADRAYGWSSRYRGMQLGGRGGPGSEVGRRMLSKRQGLETQVNNLPNMMPEWMPEMYQRGDPYTAVPGGEYRMPGEAYESMHDLHPDEYGEYGAVDRASILADVAPWSDEFRYWSQVARDQDLTPQAERKFRDALERSRDQGDKYHFTEKEYLGDDLELQDARVDKFLDHNRFTVHGSDRVFRLAGVHTTMDPETDEGQATLEVLQETMMSGADIRIRYPGNTNPDDTAPAVVYANGKNVNKMLREYGVPERDERGAIGPHTDTHPLFRGLGHGWEAMAHARIPFVQSKILNVNTPLTHFKEQNLYGKEFQNWQKPIDDIIKPNYQAAIARNPFGAAAGSGFTAGIFGLLLKGGKGFKTFGTVGALAGIGGSLWRKSHEQRTGKAWIPERRVKQREVDEYYDRLKYLKHRRLYNMYSDLAEEEEDIDLEETIRELEETQSQIDEMEEEINETVERVRKTSKYKGEYTRKVINSEGRIEHKMVTEQQAMQEIQQELGIDELREMEESEQLVGLGKYARRAIEHRQEMRSTMYGLDENATMTEMMRALPNRHREYFAEFVQEDDPETQDEILKLVSPDARRAYQMMWGREVDDVEDVEEYFEDNFLPDKDWVGWREGVDLEDAQAKTVEDIGDDPKDFGLWQNHTPSEQLTPTPYTPWEGESFNNPNPNINAVRRQIEAVLSEYDINDIHVDVKPKDQEGIDLDVRILQDKKEQAEEEIRKMLGA